MRQCVAQRVCPFGNRDSMPPFASAMSGATVTLSESVYRCMPGTARSSTSDSGAPAQCASSTSAPMQRWFWAGRHSDFVIPRQQSALSARKERDALCDSEICRAEGHAPCIIRVIQASQRSFMRMLSVQLADEKGAAPEATCEAGAYRVSWWSGVPHWKSLRPNPDGIMGGVEKHSIFSRLTNAEGACNGTETRAENCLR